MTLKRIKILDNPTPNELVKLIQNNSELFSSFLNELIKDTDSWSISDPNRFLNELMTQSLIQIQTLLNSYLTLNKSINNKQLNNNLDSWLNSLVDSTVANLILILSLIDFNNEKSKTALYTSFYEFINTAAVGTKPTLH